MACQYSDLERKQNLVDDLLSLKKIREYGITQAIENLVNDVDSLNIDKERGEYELMWQTAYSAPPIALRNDFNDDF